MKFCDPISSILTRDVITIHPDTLAEDVKNIFDEKTIHHLPVVNDYGHLDGNYK